MARYPFTVEEDSDGSVLVQFVDFEEGVTSGETLKEAIENAKDVLDLLVASYAADGKALPAPSSINGELFATTG